MQSLRFAIVCFALSLFLLLNACEAKENISKTIIVDQSGGGNFTKVQEAIDSIPSNNGLWTSIHVKAGIYNEKVVVPADKPYIFLEGEGSKVTLIQWGDFGSSSDSSTFKMYADNFVACDISFKNTHNHPLLLDVDHNVTWAPAALIQGDKASFYRCGFIGLQDTLADWQRRHYFVNCYIEGAVDFIWGGGQSIYQNCNINVTKSRISGGNAYITAQGRGTATDPSGFVFKDCVVFGTGPALLGRAYGSYSRVVFYKTHFDDIITPEGWDAWFSTGKEGTLTYSEVQCMGPGAGMSKRVKWEKTLTVEELGQLVNLKSFINQESWIESQPIF